MIVVFINMPSSFRINWQVSFVGLLIWYLILSEFRHKLINHCWYSTVLSTCKFDEAGGTTHLGLQVQTGTFECR
jgi:hypothetical protein